MDTLTAQIGETLMTRLVDASPDALFCQDADGRLLSWNAAAAALYGWTAREALGRPYRDLLCGADLEAGLQGLQAALGGADGSGGGIVTLTLLHLRRGGLPFPARVTHTPLLDQDGRVAAVATCAADTSRELALAAEVERARRERDVRDQALQRSNRDLQQFAYVASHDLSEPLRVMTGYVQLLEGRYDDVLDERGRRYMQHVVDACTRMRALIDDLLAYSQVLRPTESRGDVAPGEVLDEVLAAAATALREADATVTSGPLPRVRVDRTDLALVFSNLVTNGLKFRSPDRPCRLHVRGLERDGRLVLRVDDSGIGIAAEYRERVFRMFQRLHTREEHPGTGIGLALVQQVVERNGGAVWLEDSPLGGVTVCLSLPVAGDVQEAGA